jgi:WD40 repeat protein
VTLKGDPVYHSLSLDGKQVLWQAPDNVIHLQNRGTEEGRPLATPGLGASGRPLSMKAAAFSDDGKFVAGVLSTLIAEGQKQSVHVWETATGTEVFYQEFRDEDDLSGRLALGPDGKHLAFSSNRQVTLWNVPDKKKLRTIAGVQRANPAVLRFDRSGQILYLGKFDGVIQGHRITDGTPTGPTVRTLGDIRQILPLPDGKTMTACSEQGGRGYLRLWQPEQERDNYHLAHPDPITSLAVRPDGSEILVTTGKGVHHWNLATGKKVPPLTTLPRPARALAISLDGERIAVGGDEWDHVHLLDRNGKKLADWHHKGAGKINALAFSPDGKTVASAGYLNSPRGYVAGLLTIWDVGTGKARQPIDEQRDALTDVQFAPSGKQLAATCASGTALVLEVETGKFSTHRVNTVAQTVRWLPRGDRVVVGGYEPRENHIKTFSVSNWQGIFPMKAVVPPVRSLAVRPDGHWLACGCDNGLVLIWELGSDEPRWKLTAHSGSCNCVAFLPGGKTLVTAGSDGVIRLWDVESGEERLWP